MTGRFFPVQFVHLGPTGSFDTFNEAALPVGYEGLIGSITEDAGRVLRLVQHDDGAGAVATVAGGVAHWMTRASYIVTSDQTNAQAGVNSVCGGYLGVITDQNYCFIQCGGLQDLMVAAGTAIGNTMIGSAVDLTLAAMPDGNLTYDGLPVAVAYEAVGVDGFANCYWLLGAML